MNFIKKFIALAAVACFVAHAHAAVPANEAPDALVKRISQDVIETAKNDKAIQAGDQESHGPGGNQDPAVRRLPAHDLAGRRPLLARRHPEQQKALTEQFRTLLVFTYSGALSQVKDQTIEFKPLRAAG
jgi:phospholipid transport system substrate-binding protein